MSELNETQEPVAEEAQTEAKFEFRGFNAEPGQAEEGLSAEQADAIMGGTPEVEAQEAEAPKAEPKVKIGSREFATADEAWAYAQELEQEKLTSDAFRHGLEVAQQQQIGNPNQAPAEPPPEEEIPVEVMYDPKKLAKYIAEKAKVVADQVRQETQAQSDRVKRNDDTWAQFYKDYPDLSNAQKLVKAELDENWERLKFVDTKVALKEIAEKARAEKKRMLDDALPGVDLKTVRAGASPGNGRQVTRPPEETKTLSFVEQFNNLKKKRTARPMRR